jgi:ADP-ribosylglycohydrolase
MDVTKVISLKGLHKLDRSFYTYIGRKNGTNAESIFNNPYSVKAHGSVEEVVKLYLLYFNTIPNIVEELSKLKGKVLACWCKDKKGNGLCHGDVLVYCLDKTLTPELKSLFDSNGFEYPKDTPIVSSWYGPIDSKHMTHVPPSKVALPIISPVQTFLETGKLANLLDLDKVRGGYYGGYLGDSLGVPHEFPKIAVFKYTGVLEHQYTHRTRFDALNGRDGVRLGIGQYSDDTEMSLSLARSLVRNSGYNREDVITSYIRWANSDQCMMGTNTSKLLKNTSTKGKPIMNKTYKSRYLKKFEVSPDTPFQATSVKAEAAQSNGSLMRSFPLACVGSSEDVNAEAILNDVWITNPSSINYWCEYIHLTCVRMALMNKTPKDIWAKVLSFEGVPESVQFMLDCILQNKVVDVKTKTKGWVCFSFYTSMACLYTIAHSKTELTYTILMEWVINLGGDTDTNACIAGSLVGAILGYSKLVEEEITLNNIGTMIRSTVVGTPYHRPEEFQLVDSLKLSESLYYLGTQ